MSLPTVEDFNVIFEDSFQKDIKIRRNLKQFNKWNGLTLKTKLKRLKDNLEKNIQYLNYKYMYDSEQIEKGIHPQLGSEEDYMTNVDDDIFNHMVKMRNKRLKRQGKILVI